MNSEIMKALQVLKNNCKEHEGCEGCELFSIDAIYGCYLSDKAPEEYLEGDEMVNG